jgi:hypothetical protein
VDGYRNAIKIAYSSLNEMDIKLNKFILGTYTILFSYFGLKYTKAERLKICSLFSFPFLFCFLRSKICDRPYDGVCVIDIWDRSRVATH